MTEELSKEPNDGRTRRKGVKEPRKETVKRTRSTKDKAAGPTEAGTSDRVQTGQKSGNDSASASTTTTGGSLAGRSPQADSKRSRVKSDAGSQFRKGEGTEATIHEASTSASQNHERIARRAYALYEASGYRGEDALHHWLEAERELRNHKDDGARES